MKQWINDNVFDQDGNLILNRLKGSFFQKHGKLDELKTFTSFLPESVRSTERIYCVLQDIHIPVTCPSCGKVVSFLSINLGYNKYCSRNCTGKDVEARKRLSEIQKSSWKNRSEEDIALAIQKRDQTCLKEYGYRNVAQAPEVNGRISQTLKNGYADGTIMSSFERVEVQQKAKETKIRNRRL